MKERLDVLLTERNLAASREKAKALIMAGQVYVAGQKEDKAGSMFPEDVQIEVRGDALPYVSRGGLKLEKALQVFPIETKDRICIDIGSSTGGFTDCLLQNGASYVYAVDVGRGQLDWKLRNDPRVCSMEKTNIRYLTPDQIGVLPTLAVTDVSFISLKLVFPPMHALLAKEAEAVALIKPQFEAGREKVGKKGVVRDPQVHLEVIRNVLGYAKESGFTVMGLDFSPIRGPEGNIEYLLWLRKIPVSFAEDTERCSASEDGSEEVSFEELARDAVERAHRIL